MGEEQELQKTEEAAALYSSADTNTTKLSKLSIQEDEESTLVFLDSLDDYLVLIESLSSTLRKGWMELAGARYSMGASRVNSALLNLKEHSAATTVDITSSDDNGSTMTKSPRFSLCKWASPENNDSSSEKEIFEDDEQLKENVSNRDSENQDSLMESSNGSVTNASLRESSGSEINASPRTLENPLQKERAKVLSMFGTLVSPKLRASQLSFETALETLVEIANARSSILKAHDALHRDMKSTKE